MTNSKVQIRSSEYNSDQLTLLKNTIAEGTTNDEFAMFLEVCKRKNLDPFSKQVYCIVYKGKNRKVSIQMSIDGYRVQASRSGIYAGNDDILYNDTLTQYEHLTQFKGTKNPYPMTATATVYKLMGGVRIPFKATCNWFDYYPGDDWKGNMWRNFPYTMLGKVAEALALRKGFPDQLEGLYVEEEMHQASALPLEAPIEKVRMTAPNANEIRDLKASAEKIGVVGHESFYSYASTVLGKKLSNDFEVTYKDFKILTDAVLDDLQIAEVPFEEVKQGVGSLGSRTAWDAPRTIEDNKNLHALGATFYGTEWETERPLMVYEITAGRSKSSKDMTHGEASLMILLIRFFTVAKEAKGDEWKEWVPKWTKHLFGSSLGIMDLVSDLGYEDIERLYQTVVNAKSKEGK